MPAVPELDIFDGRRRRLYGGGSSKDDRGGVGEDMLRTGLREEDANLVDRRLIDRPLLGAGEADMSRRNGSVDAGLGVRTGADALRCPLGVVAPKGW